MERIVQTIFNSFFQTKRVITTTEKSVVVIAIIGLVGLYSYFLV